MRKEAAKFLVGGLSNFVVSGTIFFILYRSSLFSRITVGSAAPPPDRLGIVSYDAAFAQIVAYAAGFLNSFLWNRTWTFRVKSDARRRFFRFLILNLASLTLSALAMHVLVDRWHYPALPVWIAVMSLVTAVNFIGCKRWVFRTLVDLD